MSFSPAIPPPFRTSIADVDGLHAFGAQGSGTTPNYYLSSVTLAATGNVPPRPTPSAAYPVSAGPSIFVWPVTAAAANTQTLRGVPAAGSLTTEDGYLVGDTVILESLAVLVSAVTLNNGGAGGGAIGTLAGSGPATSSIAAQWNGTNWIFVPWGSCNCSISAAGVGSTLVYQPGGAAGGGVYTTWPTFAAAMATFAFFNPVGIIDGSLGTPTVSAGAWNVAGWTLQTPSNIAYTLVIPEGATFVCQNSTFKADGPTFAWANTSVPCFNVASGATTVILSSACFLQPNGAATKPFLNCASGATLDVFLNQGSVLDGTVAAPAVNCASGGECEVTGNGGIINANSLAGAGPIYVGLDATSSYATPQSATAVTLAFPARANGAGTGYSFGGVAPPGGNGVTVDTGAAGALLLANVNATSAQLGNTTSAFALSLRAGTGGLTLANNGTTYAWPTSPPSNSVGQTVSVTPAGAMSFGRSIQTGTVTLSSGVSAAIAANVSATSRIIGFLKTSSPGAGNLTVEFAALAAGRINGTPGSFTITALIAAGTINVLDNSTLDWVLFDN